MGFSRRGGSCIPGRVLPSAGICNDLQRLWNYDDVGKLMSTRDSHLFELHKHRQVWDRHPPTVQRVENRGE